MGLTQQLRFWMFLFDEWPSLAENNARNGMNLLMPSLLNYTSSFQAGAFVALATRQWATDTTGWTIRRPQLPTKLLLQGKCDNVERRNRHKFIIWKYVDDMAHLCTNCINGIGPHAAIKVWDFVSAGIKFCIISSVSLPDSPCHSLSGCDSTCVTLTHLQQMWGNTSSELLSVLLSCTRSNYYWSTVNLFDDFVVCHTPFTQKLKPVNNQLRRPIIY